VTYDDIAGIFLAPLDGPVVEPSVGESPARRLRDALEPIATQGWWSRPAGERLTALGLDFLPGYVWGRAASLGTPPSSVVVAAFGVFEPAMLAAVYDAGVASVARHDILVARAEGGTASVDAVAGADECAAIADPLLEAVERLDGLGRPLFSGLRALPVPPSPAGRLWRAAELVREHRGDGHLDSGRKPWAPPSRAWRHGAGWPEPTSPVPDVTQEWPSNWRPMPARRL